MTRNDLAHAVELAKERKFRGSANYEETHELAGFILAMAPVVEAAQAWRRERVPLDDVGKRLAEAVDYLAHEIAAHDVGE